MISIIIPTLNEEGYIISLLNCIKKQTEKELEIILVDAYSEDKTLQKVKTFKKQNPSLSIKVLNHKKRNIGAQRNAGAKKAKGDLLFFIDADILIDDHTLFSYIKNHDIKSGAFTNVRIHPRERTIIDTIVSDSINILFWASNYISPVGARGNFIVANKKAFKKVKGFNESMAIAEDADLIRRLAKLSPILFLNKTVYESPRRFRKHGYLKTFRRWVINGVWTWIFKRSYESFWDPVR